MKKTANESSVYRCVEELAKDIGLSRALTYQGLRNGEIPCIRLMESKRFIIPRAAIRVWLESAGARKVA